MAKAPKEHKRLKKGGTDADTASKLAMVAGDHGIANLSSGRTNCGRRINEAPVPSWSYGVKEDVQCRHCLDGTQFDDIEVPPGQFEVEAVLRELGVAS